MLDLDIFRPAGHPDAPMTWVCVGAWNAYPGDEGPLTDYRAGVVWTRNVWLDEYQPDRSFYSTDEDLPDWLSLLLEEGD